MKKITSLLLFLGIPVFIHAQEALFQNYTEHLPGHQPDFALRQASKVGKVYKITDKYADGQLASIQYASDIPLTLSFQGVGNSSEFYPDGKLKRSGNMEGEYRRVKEYFSNGEPYREYLEKGEEIVMVTVWDTEGKTLVQNGSGRAVELHRYDDLAVLESGAYENGHRTGEWTGFANGPYFTETYKAGRLVSGESQDKNGEKFSYKVKYVPAEFKGGEQKLYSFLSQNINMPREMTGGEMRVVTRFVIDRDGKTGSLQALNEAPDWAVREAFRVVNLTSGKWLPARLRGQQVKTEYTLPIVFVLK